MVAPAIIAAGITAAAALESQRQSSNAAASATAQGRAFASDMENRLWEREKNRIRIRVQDAKRSGVHPLFALGFPGQSTSVNLPSPSTGSYAGDGIMRAGEAIAQGVVNASEQKKLDEIHALNVAKGEQELRAGELQIQKLQSDVARAAQASNYLRGAGDGTGVLAPGIAAPSPEMRPLRVDPRVSAPLKAELIGKDGRRYWVYSEAAQADELNQIVLAMQEMGYSLGDFAVTIPEKKYSYDRRPGSKPKDVTYPHGVVTGRRKQGDRTRSGYRTRYGTVYGRTAR